MKVIKEDINRQFVELPQFRKSWKELGFGDEELFELQSQILGDKEHKNNLGMGLKKIRFKPSYVNTGKNTQVRVVYVDVVVTEQIYLIECFHKNDQENLTDNQEKSIRKTTEEIIKEILK